MTIAKDFASKLSVAFVAVAMIFMAIAPAVKAEESAEDLQKTINDLLAQVAALQSELGGEKTTTSVGSCNFMMDLKTGSTGADVMALQKFLNADEDTRVAAAGAVGSAGMETEYYGPATAAAVSKFQVKYRAEILSPAGLVNPTGFFGPSSRAQANKLCAASGDTDEDTDEDSDDSDTELSGEGTLDTFEIDDADDTDLEEGDEDMAIAELTIEATDGDIEISRMDIALTGGTDDAWDTFETVSVWVDGEKIGEVDASDEDEYLDSDDESLRFSDLGLVAMEDEKVNVTIAATIQDNLDTTGDTWTVTVDGVRYFDADGVAENDSTTDDIGGAGVTFDINAAGTDEELKFKLSSDNPDATDILVDTDTKTKGETVLVYTIEAKDNDIELNDLWVTLDTGVEDVTDVVDDVYLVIDGETFDSEATTTTGSNTQDYRFNIDGDVTVDADDSVDVEVVVDLKSTNDGVNYANSGETIKATAIVSLTDAEGADDLASGQLKGSAVGEIHTLVAEGIVVPVDAVETTTDTQGQNDTTGIFEISFDVTAVENDYYIAEYATSTNSSSLGGVKFLVEGAGTPTSANGVLSSTADEDTSGVFTVREGETETFTLTVTIDASATGNHRVSVAKIYYTENTNGTTGVVTYTPTPAQDYRTEYENINAS